MVSWTVDFRPRLKDSIAACGGDYKMSTIGEFSSPNFPESSPLNTYCIWKIGASAGHKMSLTFNQFSISQ